MVNKSQNPAASLLAALKFVMPTKKKVGDVQQQFCLIQNGWLVGSNEILTIGTRIEEDLQACPQLHQLAAALSKVSGEVSITRLSECALAVVSGAFRALVPCVDPDAFVTPVPDPVCAAINDALKQSIAAVCGLATEGARNAYAAAVLVEDGFAVGTNGFVLVEHWHGNNTPSMLLPKAAAVSISKCKKSLVGFGYSESSATFWFEDGSFVKSQLFSEKFPNRVHLFECYNIEPILLPEEFYKALKAIEPFAKSGIVYFRNGMLFSDKIEEVASTYKIESLPDGMGFTIDNLIAVKNLIQTVHFDKEKNKAFFFGENCRGVISAVYKPVDIDDEIPF